MSNDVLEDPRYRVPVAPPASGGVAWLRAAVPRFSEGDDHRRRRAGVVDLIERLGIVPFTGTPTRSLLSASGLPVDLEDDVALVAGAYQPHAEQSALADAAADRLLAAAGGRTEQAAAIVCVLVQAHAAILALIDRERAGSADPPVPATRRIGPDGSEVVVSLEGAPFGRGPHRCPGEALARHLAAAARQQT